jgi:hypothetical protein
MKPILNKYLQSSTQNENESDSDLELSEQEQEQEEESTFFDDADDISQTDE